MDKMLEFTISGSYKTAQKDIIDFENVKGIVPFQDEEIATMHVRSRYVSRWIKEMKNSEGKPMYPERIQRVRETHIDDIKETTGKLSFVGKDIKDLTFEELQDLALAKDLRRVPLYKATDLRQTRVVAYVDYSDKILKNQINHNEEGFNFAKLPSIILDGGTRKETEKKLTNEEILDHEANKLAGTTLTRKDMEAIAKDKNISFHPNISDAKLYERLYGIAA